MNGFSRTIFILQQDWHLRFKMAKMMCLYENFSSQLAGMKCLYGNFSPGGFWLISKAVYFVSRVTFVVTRGLSVVTRGQNHNPNKMNTHYIPLPNVTLGCKVFINL